MVDDVCDTLLYVVTIFVVSGGWFRNCNVDNVAAFACKFERLGEISGGMNFLIFEIPFRWNFRFDR